VKLITYKLQPRSTEFVWAYKEGTKDDAFKSALLLLEDLRNDGYDRAVVYIDGEKVRPPRNAD